MEFGLTWAKLDEMEYVTEAEKLGFTHLWVTDSGLIPSDAFVFLTVAAQHTRTMKLGMGVAVPGLRLAPTLAAGMATLNMVAPGRCFVAMGTGNTGMRLLGRKPMTLKNFEVYVRTVRNLLDGNEAEYEHNGEKHAIRFMLTEKGYRNLRDPIPPYLAGYGPKAQALAGEIADGLTTNIPRGGTLDQIWANARKGALSSGRSLDNFHLSARVNFAVLDPGEAVDSERIVNEYGPAIMTAMHSTMDRHLEFGEDPPEFLRPIWKDYLEFHMARPAAERQKMMHESHNAYVAADERRFVTPEVIKRFCIVGQPAAVLEQVRELERKGVRQLMCNFPLQRGYQMVRDYAKNIIQKL
ncbi:MAG: LLM class flavin-dependent oxidoreductase [Betaproteobacteria bacterium]|nr:LLM class flavin-dependent oxidoreductase [Betaproteobacteria bacterium]